MCCNSFPEFQFQKHGVSDTVDQLLSKNPAGLTEDGIQLVKARVLDTAQGFFETTFTSNQYATSQLLSSFYIAWWMLSVTLLIFSTSELKHLNVLSWSQSVTCPSLVKFVNGSLEISSLWQAFLSWYARAITILSMQLVYRQLKWWSNPSLQHCSGDCAPFTGDKHYQIELRKYMSRYYILRPPFLYPVKGQLLLRFAWRLCHWCSIDIENLFCNLSHG